VKYKVFTKHVTAKHVITGVHMLLEMHAHTNRHSKCSQVSPVVLVKGVVKMGLQGLVITEHHYLWSKEELEQLRKDAELNEQFILLAGQEVETDKGHILVYGVDKTISSSIELSELKKIFPGALLVWAHPFRNARNPSAAELLNPLLNGIEVFSSNHNINENSLALKRWHEYKFTAISGSDTHDKINTGIYPTQFDHPVTSIEDLISEVKNNRCRPFLKEIPKFGSNASVTEVTVGTKGADETRLRLIIRNAYDSKAWEKMKTASDIMKTIYDTGMNRGSFRVPKIIEADETGKVIIEEGQRGKSLYDVLNTVSFDAGEKYFIMAAQWLAKLHNSKLSYADASATAEKENRRLESYLKNYEIMDSPYLNNARKLIIAVKAAENRLFTNPKTRWALSHGDYHPKNIIVGQDIAHDPATAFVSVIDFGNSLMYPAAFDVGYFLAQFESQFEKHPEIIRQYKESVFLKAYMESAKNLPKDFKKQVQLFKLRANLSIASFYIKVGKGESEEMKGLIKRSMKLAKAKLK